MSELDDDTTISHAVSLVECDSLECFSSVATSTTTCQQDHDPKLISSKNHQVISDNSSEESSLQELIEAELNSRLSPPIQPDSLDTELLNNHKHCKGLSNGGHFLDSGNNLMDSLDESPFSLDSLVDRESGVDLTTPPKREESPMSLSSSPDVCHHPTVDNSALSHSDKRLEPSSSFDLMLADCIDNPTSSNESSQDSKENKVCDIDVNKISNEYEKCPEDFTTELCENEVSCKPSNKEEENLVVCEAAVDSSEMSNSLNNFCDLSNDHDAIEESAYLKTDKTENLKSDESILSKIDHGENGIHESSVDLMEENVNSEHKAETFTDKSVDLSDHQQELSCEDAYGTLEVQSLNDKDLANGTDSHNLNMEFMEGNIASNGLIHEITNITNSNHHAIESRIVDRVEHQPLSVIDHNVSLHFLFFFILLEL